MCMQVESASKAFSLFKPEEVSGLLKLTSMLKEDDAVFCEADLQADKELPGHLQVALSLTTVSPSSGVFSAPVIWSPTPNLNPNLHEQSWLVHGHVRRMGCFMDGPRKN